MKKIFLIFMLSLSIHNQICSYNNIKIDCLPQRLIKNAVINSAIGSALLMVATYSAGETLLDCGHGYYELKKVYIHYLTELEALEHSYIMSADEKHFWAFNQMLSRIPKVFWREIIAGTFTVFTGILACKYMSKMGKSLDQLNAIMQKSLFY